MRNKLMSFLVVLVVAMFVVGCSGKSKIQESDNTEVVERSPGAGAMPGGAGGGAQTQPLGGQGQGQGLGVGAGGQGGSGVGDGSGSGSGADGMSAADMQNLLSKRRIYFEFDSSSIDDEGRAIIGAHAAHLVRNGGINITLEGHADERGTREYNLALGERRAKAVLSAMEALGVASSRIQTVSLGEERPVALAHDEEAWHLNRRVEIIYNN
ncbi:peptidoglycan-associated lipoprotein Pal [Pseudomonadota bacterium]